MNLNIGGMQFKLIRVTKPKDGELSDTRRKAIKILEAMAEKLGNESIFDNRNMDDKAEPDGTWYEYEDLVTNLLGGDGNSYTSSYPKEKV